MDLFTRYALLTSSYIIQRLNIYQPMEEKKPARPSRAPLGSNPSKKRFNYNFRRNSRSATDGSWKNRFRRNATDFRPFRIPRAISRSLTNVNQSCTFRTFFKEKKWSMLIELICILIGVALDNIP